MSPFPSPQLLNLISFSTDDSGMETETFWYWLKGAVSDLSLEAFTNEASCPFIHSGAVPDAIQARLFSIFPVLPENRASFLKLLTDGLKQYLSDEANQDHVLPRLMMVQDGNLFIRQEATPSPAFKRNKGITL